MAALVATETTNPTVGSLKVTKPYNPLASPGGHYDGDTTYKYANYKPVLPKVSWPPLEEQPFTERGALADPSKPNLLKDGVKIRNLTPAIGAEVTGLDLRQLTDAQKDELVLLVAERGAVFLRNQEASIHELLSLGRYYGPLHKHSTTGVPKEPGLEEVHVVYADKTRRPDVSAYTTLELWHADVTNEMQPPGTTIFKVLVCPGYGGDTIWSSGYALYSSLSPYLQTYLESLSAVHSGVQQAEGARAGGGHVRREPVENVHPLVRVHPATGLKSVFVNPGFTRRIVGVPKAESETILNFLYTQLAQTPGFQVRWHWQENDVVIFDNRIAAHAATLDFYPAQRHALRVTTHAERPLSVKAYEEKTGKKALDWQKELNKALGVEDVVVGGEGAVRGYAD